jgi:SEC-C motif-containing protein
MRSRYAAYALGLSAYVIETTAPNGPRARRDRDGWVSEVLEFSRRTRFVGLEILEAREDGDQGQVCFRAILTEAGADVSFEERSGFVRVGGRWFYSSGSRVRRLEGLSKDGKPSEPS